MSTRAMYTVVEKSLDQDQLIKKIKSKKLILYYNHSDGYPEGLGKHLQLSCKLFNTLRGVDAEYMQAWLMFKLKYDSMNDYKEFHKELYKTEANEEKLIEHTVTGQGITMAIHGDIEYFYVIDLQRMCIDCYETNCWDDITFTYNTCFDI